jgi:hypothetical protein
MRWLFTLVVIPLFGQSPTITSPASSSALTGTVTFSETCSDCTGHSQDVWYDQSGDVIGITDQSTGFQLTWPSVNLFNGYTRISFTAYDGTGAVIATSPQIPYKIANVSNNAIYTGRTLSLEVTDPNNSNTLGQNAPSTWSSTVSLAVTLTGYSSGDGGVTYEAMFDGFVACSGSSSPLLCNTVNGGGGAFINGVHQVVVWATANNGTGMLVYGEWKGLVTFSN